MTATISQFAVSAEGFASWLNPGSPVNALYVLDTVSGRGAKLAATATSYQLPAGGFAAGDAVDLVRAGGSVFTATIPAPPFTNPVNVSPPVITRVG
jgi:hypothetical protein